jgi:hypothetical protein
MSNGLSKAMSGTVNWGHQVASGVNHMHQGLKDNDSEGPSLKGGLLTAVSPALAMASAAGDGKLGLLDAICPPLALLKLLNGSK